MDRLLMRLAEQRPAVRVGLVVLLAVLVYLLGRLVVVGSLQERADEVRAEADRAARRLESQRQRVERFEPAPGALEADAESLRARLGRAAEDFPAGLRSGLLTALSTAAEEAGAGSPLFNRGEKSSSGGVLRGLRVLTVRGDLDAGTRSVASFLARLERLPVPVTVDSLALRRAAATNLATLRLRVLVPEEGE